jgi:hypothetical protein
VTSLEREFQENIASRCRAALELFHDVERLDSLPVDELMDMFAMPGSR